MANRDASQFRIDLSLDPGLTRRLDDWRCGLLNPASRPKAIKILLDRALSELEVQAGAARYLTPPYMSDYEGRPCLIDSEGNWVPVGPAGSLPPAKRPER